MRDIQRRFNETMKQIKRGKLVLPVKTFNVKRVGHSIPVPGVEIAEVRPMSLRQIKKREPDAMRNDSKEFYPDNIDKPKMIVWKAYGKNTPPERVSRILA